MTEKTQLTLKNITAINVDSWGDVTARMSITGDYDGIAELYSILDKFKWCDINQITIDFNLDMANGELPY